MQAFRRLAAWQRCHDLALAVYRASSSWPDDERFGVTSQARRAAVSAEAAIAEGAAKRGSRKFRRYLDIANDSLAELAYLLTLASDLRYLSPEGRAQLEALRDEAGRLTWRLYESLRVRRTHADRPTV